MTYQTATRCVVLPLQSLLICHKNGVSIKGQCSPSRSISIKPQLSRKTQSIARPVQLQPCSSFALLSPLPFYPSKCVRDHSQYTCISDYQSSTTYTTQPCESQGISDQALSAFATCYSINGVRARSSKRVLRAHHRILHAIVRIPDR